MFSWKRAAEAPEETGKLVQNDIYTGDWCRKPTKCGVRQSGKYSACRIVQVMIPVWCVLGCIKTDNVIAVRQRLKNQSVFVAEKVPCAEMTDRSLQVRNPNSQVENGSCKLCNRKGVSSYDIIDERRQGKNQKNISLTSRGFVFGMERFWNCRPRDQRKFRWNDA